MSGTAARVPLLVPAGRANLDRGVAPTKAGTPEETAHRRQSWAVARQEWETTRPDLDTPIARDRGWTAIPMPEKSRRYWQAYDTPTARTITTSPHRATELGWATPASSTAAATPAPASTPASRAGAMAGEAVGSGVAGPRVGVDRGIAPSKAATPAEAERRRQAWRVAEENFTSTLPAGTGIADTSAAWEGLSWQDKAPLYWRAYEQAPTTAGTPAWGSATNSPAAPAPNAPNAPSASAGAEGVEGIGRSPSAPAPATSTPAAPRSASSASSAPSTTTGKSGPVRSEAGEAGQVGEAARVSRARVVELNGAAADWFATQAGPGSRGRTYLQDRLGADVVTSSLPATPTPPSGTVTSATGLPGPQWRVGYAPPGWTGLVDHLRQVGAHDEELLAAGLARTSSRGTLIDVFRDRAMVGIRDRDGDVVGFVGRDLSGQAHGVKYLNTGPTPAFRKGDHLLGAYEALQVPGAKITRTEGPFDAIAVTAAGRGQIAGVTPLGTALTPTQAGLLADLAVSRDGENARGRVWIATDADPAGRAAAARDFWTLREHADGIDARLLPLPAGSDPAQLWQEQPTTLQPCSTSRTPRPVPGSPSSTMFSPATGWASPLATPTPTNRSWPSST